MDVINIISIIVSPIIAVIVGQILQNNSKKRAEKLEIFKTLMVSRGLGWSVESVRALNVIEVVFGDDKNVLNQWKIYYDRLCVENTNETELAKIKSEGDKLLEVIAKSLGYKITWETIQKPSIPQGLTDNLTQQQQYMNNQLSVMNLMNSYMQNMSLNKTNKQEKL